MKKICILSIDGGGIRGIIPGVILTYIEQQLQKKMNSQLKIGDYFDLLAGTSTGGILTCAYLVPGENNKAKYSAQDAVNLYFKEGGGIFHTDLCRKISTGFGLLKESYDVQNLATDLDDFFGDTMLNQLIKPCMVTSYEITSRNAVFFTSADANDPLNNFKVKDVARATSAAPTYFSPAHIHSSEGQLFSLIDGGVYANNPAMCAYAEARKIDFATVLNNSQKPDKPFAKNMLIISIGTGSVTTPYHYKDFKNAGDIKWLDPLIDILMSASSETVTYQLKQMYDTLGGDDKNDYYRLEPGLHEADAAMDNAEPDNLEKLRQAGLWFVEKNESLLNEIIDKIVANQ